MRSGRRGGQKRRGDARNVPGGKGDAIRTGGDRVIVVDRPAVAPGVEHVRNAVERLDWRGPESVDAAPLPLERDESRPTIRVDDKGRKLWPRTRLHGAAVHQHLKPRRGSRDFNLNRTRGCKLGADRLRAHHRKIHCVRIGLITGENACPSGEYVSWVRVCFGMNRCACTHPHG